MSVSAKAKEAYSKFKKLKKIRTYGKLVKEALNDDTRPGALMKLGIRGMLDIAGKALGTSLTSHPYFTYHKAHLEAMAQALNASSNHEKALESLNRAIRSADATENLTKVLDDYHHRRKVLKLTYAAFIAGSVDLLRDNKSNAQSQRQIKEAGHTPESLKSFTDESIYEWRARWCELFLESVELLAMAHVEFRVTEQAMKKFEDKMKALKSGGSIGVIGAYSVEKDRQWQQYDRMVNSGAGSSKAVEDPVEFAKDQLNTIEGVTNLLGEGCEAVMSDDAYNSAALILRLGSK